MKTIYISLVLWFLFSIPSLGQVLVQNNGYKQVETSIAVHPNNSNIIAASAIELYEGGRRCIVWLSTNNGASWVQKKSVDNVTDPVVEFDNYGNILFCYLDKSDIEIYFIKSSTLGSTWTAPLKISNAGNYDTDKEWIAVDQNNNIYLTWWETAPGSNTTLKFSRSTNGGSSFTTPASIYSTPYTICAPFVAAGNNGSVYISFTLLKDYKSSNASFDLAFV